MSRKELSVEHPKWGTIRLIYNPRARHIILRAHPDAIIITLPPNTKNSDIENALEKYGDSLKIKQTEISKKIDADYYLDRPLFRLNIQKCDIGRIRLTGCNGKYILQYPSSIEITEIETQEELRIGITAAIRHRAEEILPARLRELSQQHKLQYSSVSVRKSHTRWGSCSNKGAISLSIYLVLLPQELIDYVILHELCHTIEMNHSPRFWALLDKLCNCSSKGLRLQLKHYKTDII